MDQARGHGLLAVTSNLYLARVNENRNLINKEINLNYSTHCTLLVHCWEIKDKLFLGNQIEYMVRYQCLIFPRFYYITNNLFNSSLFGSIFAHYHKL